MSVEASKAKSVLIVDDEPTLVFFLMQGLRESDIPYEVNSASNAEAGVSL